MIAQELAKIKDLKLLKEECGWDEDKKDYLDMKNTIRKKYKGLMEMMKMNRKMSQSGSSHKSIQT